MNRQIYVKTIVFKKANKLGFEIEASTKEALTVQEIVDAISETLLLQYGAEFEAEEDRLDS